MLRSVLLLPCLLSYLACDVEPIVGAQAAPGAQATYAADCRAAAYTPPPEARGGVGSTPGDVGGEPCSAARSGLMNSPIDGCVACWCAELACASDSDCPSPPGDATAACDEGVCVQRCEDELDCPTGMNCALATSDYPDGILAPEADGLRRCVWPIDDAFVCDGVSESDGDDFRDPCAEIGDPEACGAMTSTELSQRCAWLEFSALAPDGCESLASVGQCVHIVDGVCDPGNRCDDSEAHVYTRRDGERTLVAALPGCATVVAGPSGEIRPCNLDAPWTDESCGCAC